MPHEITPSASTVDPSLIDPTVVDPEVYDLAVQGIRVAHEIARAEEFNYGAADFLLRNVAGLFNGGDAVDEATLAELNPVDVGRLQDLSIKTYTVLGEKAKQEAELTLAAYRPRTEGEARVIMMQHSFNTFQVAVSMGPERGYDAAQEPAIRDLVEDYAETFASTYCGLSGIDHPVANQPGQRRYFASNIQTATPSRETGQSTRAVDAGYDVDYPSDELWI